MLPGSLAIQVFTALCISSGSVSGGRPFCGIPELSSLPAQSARGKSRHQRSAGLLTPLPIPRGPWSHIILDFIMGLPPSDGHTTILTIVNRFSKAVHFVTLPKLPLAAEMGDFLVQHVFRSHSFPRDIVSDGGPQFASWVWHSFCVAFGAQARLTSGYHPQSNR